MGLASVHGIVHELGGHIVVDTAPGRGTRFRVLFPMLTAAQEGELADAEPRVPARRLHGRVLVVDDEQSVATFMRDLLESWGLEVTIAASAIDAASQVSQDAQRFDLVITDQMMPRMTGTRARARACANPARTCRSSSTPASTKASRTRTCRTRACARS